MASLRKKPNSPYWIACYTTADGKQDQKSTKLLASRANEKKALEIADGYEQVACEAKTETQVRKVIADITTETLGKPVAQLTCDGWFNRWLLQMASEVKASTLRRYTDCVVLARKFAPAMCAKPLDHVTHIDVRDFRDELCRNRSAGTTNFTIMTIRQAFTRAEIDNLLLKNPARGVKPVKRNPEHEKGEKRRAFTIDQVRTILAVAPDDEWRGMILAGFYSCGQRLGDICKMLVRQVDLEHNVTMFAGDQATTKTERTVEVPVTPEWRADLVERVKGKRANDPLFPRACGWFGKGGDRASGISNRFYTILIAAGLGTPWKKRFKETEPGRRRMNAYTWHSFRHTATTDLKSRQIGQSIVMDMVGQETVAVSEVYTHIPLEVKRAALMQAWGTLTLGPAAGAAVAANKPQLEVLKGKKTAAA